MIFRYNDMGMTNHIIAPSYDLAVTKKWQMAAFIRHMNEKLLLDIAGLGALSNKLNGRVSACRYGQKQKSYRKFPPASILA